MVVNAARGDESTFSEPPRRSWGMRLDTGGVGVAVHGLGAAAATPIESRFGAFAAGRTEVRFTVHIVEDVETPPTAAGCGGPGEPARIEGDGYVATIDWGARLASVAGPAVADGVEAVMRLALPHLLHDGLLVHGAVLLGDARGFLCVGPSGAGKSTLARLLPDRALGDELAVVRIAGPSWSVGSFPTTMARPGTVPLARIFFLRHASSHERQRLSPAQAARLLAEQCHWLTEDPEPARRAFDVLTRLVADVPCYDLAFAPHACVWDLIAGPE